MKFQTPLTGQTKFLVIDNLIVSMATEPFPSDSTPFSDSAAEFWVRSFF